MAPKPIAPQAQESNYATVFNIGFRPPHKPLPTGANTKLKCPSCGVWALKGSTCKVCRTPIPGPRRIANRSSPAPLTEVGKARSSKKGTPLANGRPPAPAVAHTENR
ncbi:hypothetical protein ABB37_03096 [Leptomonas pyrrhocoris]|uniref:Uncharacterized protein n=1 Tax=Leptomonas pyrrhocoris TaxID=157538 RepID=A0A0N0VGR9_LEPPY|nr:hypothetical protein ABB37_03096 [Leptomonas pyrrhocoris]KPA83484.1 hypothetical protein ABB37_03096 [Leptomonas pyrrhocoris]|eukprot:XP_015661923.1 hypothetical protein ABB37_03096 [Leptomonas pyrrhocoris]